RESTCEIELPAARAPRLHHVVAKKATLLGADPVDPDTCAAQEARLAVRVAAAHGGQMCERHLATHPDDLVRLRQLDLELHQPRGVRRVEGPLDPQAERG